MKNFNFFFLALILLGTTGCEGVDFNDLKDLVIEQPHEEVREVLPAKHLVIIADGTGSTSGTYAIPQVTTEWLEACIDRIRNTGGGSLFLTKVDRDSRNNQVHNLTIPQAAYVPARPAHRPGVTSFDYNREVETWEKTIPKYRRDSIDASQRFARKRVDFLKMAANYLQTEVYHQGLDNQASDLIGTLNSANGALKDISDPTANKYIVAFSDMEHFPMRNFPSKELMPIPSDTELIMVNPATGSTDMVTDAREVSSPDRVLDILFH